MNDVEMALATVVEWFSWNLGRSWNQTTRKTPRIAGTFVDTAVVPSRDFKGSRNNRDRETVSKNLGPSSGRTRAVGSWSYPVMLLVAIAAIKLGLAKGTREWRDSR
ncbi:unnamed protein product [Ectocarpus sp. 12 AP-2014]